MTVSRLSLLVAATKRLNNACSARPTQKAFFFPERELPRKAEKPENPDGQKFSPRGVPAHVETNVGQRMLGNGNSSVCVPEERKKERNPSPKSDSRPRLSETASKYF